MCCTKTIARLNSKPKSKFEKYFLNFLGFEYFSCISFYKLLVCQNIKITNLKFSLWTSNQRQKYLYPM